MDFVQRLGRHGVFLGWLVLAACGSGGDGAHRAASERGAARRGAKRVAPRDAGSERGARGASTTGAGIGRLAPPGLPKRLFAKRFVVKVRAAPDRSARRIGYLRGGAVLQATSAEPVGRERCRRGWYELETGGFVCAGRDVIPFTGKRLPEVRARQPRRAAPLPYEYAFVRRNRTPMYRRLPTPEEIERFEGPKQPPASPVGSSAGDPSDEGSASVGQVTVRSSAGDGGQLLPVARVTEGDAASSDRVARSVADGGVIAVDAGPPTLASLQANEEGSPLLMWLMRGFYLSLDREFRVGRRRYWRTQFHEFVPARALFPVEGSSFEGVRLDGEHWALPVAFAISRRARRFERRENGRLRPARDPVSYHDAFRVVGRERIRGRDYLLGADGYLYRDRYVTVVEARERPEQVGPHDKWIDVDLSKQALTAYEGDRPVYVTLVSTGRVRREGDPNLDHRTPTGLFRISSKHLTHNMDGDNAIDGPYSIEDVPFVMYFQLAYALHAAFWHDRFGRPKSHGCVNLAPRDARWLFEWAEPRLPEGWHGVYPDERQPGTWVHIHGETPKG